ncbi:hypothetical protein TSUD_367030 [Trifolium subterraneum]|uniref:Uncharacterized protein n=1 Tax=Trifolium subterraneum TaxID=3900 RepID=A0A2Z6N6M7_TRISU|nr:hypothetical protein TSUD_367030 [Trifolium subterraneum]
MLHERERIQREKLRDLAVFERLNGNPAKSSPALAVKKCYRSTCVDDPHEKLQTVAALYGSRCVSFTVQLKLYYDSTMKFLNR